MDEMRLAADRIHYQTMGQAFCQIYDGDQYRLEAVELEGVGDESFNGLRNTQWIYPAEILCVMRLVFFTVQRTVGFCSSPKARKRN